MKSTYLKQGLLSYFGLVLATTFISTGLSAQAGNTGDTVNTGPCGIKIVQEYTNSNAIQFSDSYFFETFASVPESRTFRKWTFSDGTEAIGKNVKHNFTKPGTYTVTLYKAFYDTLIDPEKVCIAMYYDITKGEYNPCHYRLVCENKQTVSVIINEVSGDTCKVEIDYKNSGLTYFFSNKLAMSPNAGTVVTYYLWDFGDGAYNKELAAEHIYEKPGVYKVRLTKILFETAHGEIVCESLYYDSTIQEYIPCYFKKLCSESVSIKINVEESVKDVHCQADIQYTLNENTINFNDLYVMYSQVPENVKYYWRWDYGDGAFSNERENSHTYQNPGTYTVSLTKTAEKEICDGIKNDSTINSTVYCYFKELCRSVFTLQVKIDLIIDPPSLCHSEVSRKLIGTTLIATDTFHFEKYPYTVYTEAKKLKYFINWHWDFGDSISSNGKVVKHEYSGPGVYTLALTKTAFLYDSLIKNECLNDSVYEEHLGIYVPCNFVKSCEETSVYLALIEADPQLCKSTLSYSATGNTVLFKDTIFEKPKNYVDIKTFFYFSYGDGSSGTSFQHTYDSSKIYQGSYTKAVYKAILYVKDCGPVQAIDETLQTPWMNCNWQLVCIETYNFKVDLTPKLPECFIYNPSSDLKDTIEFSPVAIFYTAYDDRSYGETYLWDFGDSTTMKGPDVGHKYTQPGRYQVCLFRSDRLTKYAPCCKWIDIKNTQIVASVFPQPFIDNGIFTLHNFDGVYDLQFFDLNARLIKTINNNKDANLQLDRSGLQSGLYFYQVVSGDKVIFRGKMVIR